MRQGDKRSPQQLPGSEVSLQDTEDGISSQQPPALEQTPLPKVALKLKIGYLFDNLLLSSEIKLQIGRRLL